MFLTENEALRLDDGKPEKQNKNLIAPPGPRYKAREKTHSESRVVLISQC